jgi:hypothetical protein
MWAAAISVVGAAVGFILAVVRPIFKRLHNAIDSWDSFTRDWFGEPAEPGRSAVPGVMERLNRIDGELKRNGGSSMKDGINRIEKKINEIDSRLIEGDTRMTKIEERL